MKGIVTAHAYCLTAYYGQALAPCPPFIGSTFMAHYIRSDWV